MPMKSKILSKTLRLLIGAAEIKNAVCRIDAEFYSL